MKQSTYEMELPKKHFDEEDKVWYTKKVLLDILQDNNSI